MTNSSLVFLIIILFIIVGVTSFFAIRSLLSQINLQDNYDKVSQIFELLNWSNLGNLSRDIESSIIDYSSYILIKIWFVKRVKFG